MNFKLHKLQHNGKYFVVSYSGVRGATVPCEEKIIPKKIRESKKFHNF